jgi:integrase/recombinase XerD
MVTAAVTGRVRSRYVALLAYTGMRVSELIGADVQDMTLHQGQPILPIVGKGRKDRVVPLPPALYERVQRYLASRPDREVLPATTGTARVRLVRIAQRGGRRR